MNDPPPASGPGRTTAQPPFRTAVALAFAYVLLCSVYILLSSARAAELASSVIELQRFEQWKGVGFVAVTGLFFFAATWIVLRRLAAQQQLLERQQTVLAAAEGPALAGAFSAAVAPTSTTCSPWRRRGSTRWRPPTPRPAGGSGRSRC